MHRIVKININDIIYDYREASQIINNACNRSEKMQVVGMFQNADNIFISLEPSFENKKYIFSKFNSPDEDDLLIEIKNRYNYNFSFIGKIEINNDIWGLFANNK